MNRQLDIDRNSLEGEKGTVDFSTSELLTIERILSNFCRELEIYCDPPVLPDTRLVFLQEISQIQAIVAKIRAVHD